jgi:ABC-type nitrate/sulfonate/bicarbonate transport system permease component
MSSLRRTGCVIASVCAFLLIWQFGSTHLFNPSLIPPPSTVGRTAWTTLLAGGLVADIIASLRRVAVGLVFGTVAGIAVGLLVGRIAVFELFVDPLLQFFRNLSPTAMIPLAIVWFGIGESSKYFLIFWGSFFFVLVNTTAGVHATPRTRIRAAECLGASRLQVFTRVVLPSSLPHVCTGVRLALASAFLSIIPAELLAATSGIGYFLQQASMMAQTDRLFVALAVIATLGFLADWAVRILFSTVFGRYTNYLARL